MEYSLPHGGTPYILSVPTTTWNVFLYPIRGSTYPIGEKVPFTPLEKNRWYPLPIGVGYTLLHGEGTLSHGVGYTLLHGEGTLTHGVGYTLLHGKGTLPHEVGYSQTQWCEEGGTRLTFHTTVK